VTIRDRYHRVMDMARLRMAGKTFKQIAAELGGKPGTVRALFVREFTTEERQSMRRTWKVERKEARNSPSLNQNRNLEIAERRRAGEALAAIGKDYGVTREYVRQICKRLGAEPPAKPIESKLPGRKVFHRWLKAAGYRKCYGGCKQWKRVEEMTSRSAFCRPCNAARQRKLWAAKPAEMKAKAQSYRANHPEVHKRASRKWAQAHPEKMAENSRRQYARLKAEDPERLKEYSRRSYQRRKERRREAN